MSSNAPDNGGGGGGGGGGGNNDNNNNDVVNYVALVVSLVALVGTVAQVLQQYYASAAGFSNCDKNVMGLWGKTARRIFRPTELRFEVRFEAPVIFVCPPTNRSGPVKGVPIAFVDGTPESLQDTRTLPEGEEEKQRQSTREYRVHTADNERATWVTLLSQLHKMERESREWLEDHYGSVELESEAMDKEKPVKAELAGHTLAVAVQAKQRSWDTMPAGVKKPYATTTMCHMLEIAAIMGLYWKEFDRSKDRYRAEGNGYILTGAHVADLGLMFTFQISGGSRFQENRVIPVDEVKELCCGTVSTLFRADQDSRRLRVVIEDMKDLGILQLGSTNEISETLVQIDCNIATASFFRKELSHSHLFPVPFELLGMLCKKLHIKGSPFRLLPNPTPYQWDRRYFNLRKIVNEFQKRAGAKNAAPGVQRIPKIMEAAKKVVEELEKNKKRELSLRKEVNHCLEKKQDGVRREEERQASPQPPSGAQIAAEPQKPRAWWQLKLPEALRWLSKKKPADQARDVENQTLACADKGQPELQIKITDEKAPQKSTKSRPGYTVELLNALDEAIDECDKFLRREDRALVRTVLREHFQEVVKLLRGEDDDDDTPVAPGKQGDGSGRRKTRNFHELGEASPEDRQREFMNIYFNDILPEVTKRAASSLSKMTFDHRRPYLQSPKQSMSYNALLSPEDIMSGDPSDAESDAGGDSKEKAGRLEPRAQAIWCALIFRMLCWLTLHDFDKNDKQTPKSELLGSRLPVYIS